MENYKNEPQKKKRQKKPKKKHLKDTLSTLIGGKKVREKTNSTLEKILDPSKWGDVQLGVTSVHNITGKKKEL